MSVKGAKIPDSDETARKRHQDNSLEQREDAGPGGARQTSNKSGKHSSVLKLAASRPEGGTGTKAKPVSGAFGKPGAAAPNQGVPRAKTKGKRG